MIKKYLPKILVTSLITVLPILFGLIMWGRLPELVPSHFNAEGTADGYMPKAVFIFALPAAMLLVHVFCTLLTLADPKRKNIDGKPFLIVLWICPLMSLLVNGLCYALALGIKVNVTTAVFLGIGIMFIFFGNYLPKCGQNYSIGIKVPWALNDEDNWRATHRFAGKIYVAVGIITVIAAFFAASFPWLVTGYIVLAAIAGSAPMLYSYVYYVKHGKKE